MRATRTHTHTLCHCLLALGFCILVGIYFMFRELRTGCKISESECVQYLCVRWKLIAAQRRISWVAVVSTPLLSYYWMYYVLSYLVAIVDCFQYQYNRHDAIRLNERQHIQFLLGKQSYCRVTKKEKKMRLKTTWLSLLSDRLDSKRMRAVTIL